MPRRLLQRLVRRAFAARRIGYTWVTLDMEGFASGKNNRVLPLRTWAV